MTFSHKRSTSSRKENGHSSGTPSSFVSPTSSFTSSSSSSGFDTVDIRALIRSVGELVSVLKEQTVVRVQDDTADVKMTASPQTIESTIDPFFKKPNCDITGLKNKKGSKEDNGKDARNAFMATCRTVAKLFLHKHLGPEKIVDRVKFDQLIIALSGHLVVCFHNLDHKSIDIDLIKEQLRDTVRQLKSRARTRVVKKESKEEIEDLEDVSDENRDSETETVSSVSDAGSVESNSDIERSSRHREKTPKKRRHGNDSDDDEIVIKKKAKPGKAKPKKHINYKKASRR
jgi:hypothetical protein